MKRNYPPDRSVPELAEEHQIIEDRLNELYPNEQATACKIGILKKGHYLSDLHHVRVDPLVKLHSMEGLVQYSSMLSYHYLRPYQALYLLDTRQLIIYFNELPLSLAEAYKLLLRNRADLVNYCVFCYLNRSAFFCLDPETLTPKNERTKSSQPQMLDDAGHDSPTTPLLQIDKEYCTNEEVLRKLRAYGPRDLNSSKEALEGQLVVTFDAYKRETFAKNKPRRGKRGCPDHFVVVCDEKSPLAPSSAQLADFRERYGEEAQLKLLFCIVDGDGTMSFAQFDPVHPTDLHVDQTTWPERISVSRLPAARQF